MARSKQRSTMYYATVSLILVGSIVTFVLGCPGPEKELADKAKNELSPGSDLTKRYTQEPTITVVQENGEKKQVKLEQYIEGVVAGEMKPDWPEEAYRAQAILARSYAMQLLTEDGTKDPAGEISGSHKSAQAYKPQNISDDIRQAVKDTRGEVMIYKNKFVQAYFHSASGGKTAKAEDMGLVEEGKEPPYLKQVNSKEDKAESKVKSWKASFPISELEKVAKDMGHEVTGLKEVKIGKKDSGGRAVTLRLVGANGTKEVNANGLRVGLDPEKMQSTMLRKINVEGNSVVMEGAGFGHGVGMSQWGAYTMAKDGKNAEEIIKYYFKDIEFARLWK